MIMPKNTIPKLYQDEIERELKTNKNLTDEERRKLKRLLLEAKVKNFFVPKDQDQKKY